MTVLAEYTKPHEQHTAEIRVLITPHLKHTPYLILDDLPITVVILRQGIPAGDCGTVFDELDPAVRAAWLTPWGIPLTDNAWDYIDPGMILHPDQVKPPHRLTPATEAQILRRLEAEDR